MTPRQKPEPIWEALERSSGPPSFCSLRSVLGVASMSLLAAWMISLGSDWPVDAQVLLSLVVYAIGLGLFCAYLVCACGGLLARMGTRLAWFAAWVIVVLGAWVFSYLAGIVSTVWGIGPGAAAHATFVGKSVLAAAIVSLALFRYLFIRARWEADMLSEAEARVEALQARIRPHFLFNSLNTIASLIHDDPRSAERATEDLAELFRGGMRRSEDMIPLADELSLGRKYLSMEQRRLGERLKIEWDTDDLPGQEPVLPMLLQPLLENAVAHGVQPHPEGGTVRVFGCLEGGNIVVTVTNPLAPSGSKPGHGMALGNIRSRLALTYSSLASLMTHWDDSNHYAVLTIPHAQNPDR